MAHTPHKNTALAREFSRHVVRARCGTRSGFTILELLVTILVIGILLGLLIVGFRAAALGARRSAEQASVRAMAVGVATFESQLGFVPPLVHDGDDVTDGPMTVLPPVWTNEQGTSIRFAEAPVDTTFELRDGTSRFTPATYDPRFVENQRFLRGLDEDGFLVDPDTPASAFDPDQRYSKFSLSYYLAGALPPSVDGVQGGGSGEPAMVEPLRNGAFRGVRTDDDQDPPTGTSSARRRFAPFFSAEGGGASTQRNYVDPFEYREHDPDLAGEDIPDAIDPEFARYYTAIVNSEGRAFRYYRWEPEPRINTVLDYNIPRVLLDAVLYNDAVGDDGLPGGSDDDVTVDPTDPSPTDGVNQGDPELKGARWAIVGPGPDGMFGTEERGDLAEGLQRAARPGMPSGILDGFIEEGAEERLARRWARIDNTVEVGR